VCRVDDVSAERRDVLVQVVAQLTSTVPARLTSVNANLKPVRDFCETV